MVLGLWISTTRRWISYEEKTKRRAWAVPSTDKVWYCVDFIYGTTRSAMHWYASLDIYKTSLSNQIMDRHWWIRDVEKWGDAEFVWKCRPWSLCGRLSPANLIPTPTRCSTCSPFLYRLLWFLPIYNHCDFYVLIKFHQQMIPSILNENISKPCHREKIVLDR